MQVKMDSSWYSIECKKDQKSARIDIYEQIGENFWGEGVSAKKFVQDLSALDVESIDLHINSPGGNVFDGNAIYNALKAHKAEITVTIDGIAASMASVIAMAGKTIRMPENAMLMIHDPSGLVVGTAADMRKYAEVLERLKGGLLSAYMQHANADKEKVGQMMSDETWFTADEAIAIGFATEKISGVQAQACAFDMLSQFKKVPQAFLAIAKPTKEKKMELTLGLIKKEHPEIAQALREEGRSEYLAEGAAAERSRIQEVLAQAMPGHEALLQQLAFDGVTTGPQAAVAVLAAEKKIRGKAAENLATDGIAPAAHAPAPDQESLAENPALPIEERAKKAWDKDEGLRIEFRGSYDGYLAYRKAEEAGRARILKKQ